MRKMPLAMCRVLSSLNQRDHLGNSSARTIRRQGTEAELLQGMLKTQPLFIAIYILKELQARRQGKDLGLAGRLPRILKGWGLTHLWDAGTVPL